MTEYCEIAEELVTATSSVTVETIAILSNIGAASSSVHLGITQQLTIGTAEATSAVVIDAYALLQSSASTTSVVTGSATVTKLLIDDETNATSRLFATFNQSLVSTGNAVGSIVFADAPALLVSSAVASSVVLPGSILELVLQSAGNASSSVKLGYLESVESAAVASSVVTTYRVLGNFATSTAAAISMAFPTAVPQGFVLVSTASGISSVVVQLDASDLLTTLANATSDVWFKDPGRVAWVLNTETTAGSWYNNFDFESIAQPPGTVLAVGPDGLYELNGDTDSGERIDSEVVSGFEDFGLAQTKHVDNYYFGYTSAGQISVTVEVYESGHSPTTYLLEERSADAPRNSRVTPGKGLFGRYWRTTIRNVDGAGFEIHDASADIAVSTRKV